MIKISLLLPLLLVVVLSVSAQKKKKVNTPAQKPPSALATTADTSILSDLKENILDNIPTVSLDENDLGDGSSQNISSVLTAGRDPFFSAASFNFSAVRFKVRLQCR